MNNLGMSNGWGMNPQQVEDFIGQWRTQTQNNLVANDPKYRNLSNQMATAYSPIYNNPRRTSFANPEQQRAYDVATGNFETYKNSIMQPQEQMVRTLLGGQITPQMFAGNFMSQFMPGSRQQGQPGQPNQNYQPAIGLNAGYSLGLSQRASPYSSFQQANQFVR